MTRSVLLALVLLLAGCGESRPPWAEGAVVREARPAAMARQDLGRFEARLLDRHNRERVAVGVPPLIWDPALASAATPYAAELARLGRLAHSELAARPDQGENLWMGTRGAYSLEEMVGNWAEEKRLFRPGVFPDVSTSGHWSDVGHYTQMIWRTTARVGCALDRTSRSDVLVCRYAPAGNVRGQRVP